MKKFFSLFAAMLFAGSMMAVTLDPATQTVQTTETDINLTIEGIGVAYHGTLMATTDYDPASFRIYAGNTLTLSASTNITKVVIAGLAKKDLAPTVDHGTITTGTSFSADATKKTLADPLIVIENINATSLTINCNKQLRAYLIMVVLDGESGEIPVDPITPSDAIQLDVAYADAWYLADYEAWELNLYKDFNESTYEVTYPDVYIDFYAKSATALAGTYTTDELAYAFVYLSENDSVETETFANNMVIEHKGNGVYSVQFSFVANDGKTYAINWQGEIYAYDDETGTEITLVEGGTTPVEPGELATEGVHTLTPVEADAAGSGSYDIMIDGIQLTWTGAYYATDFRPYAGNTLTITAGANIAKVEIAGTAKKDLAPTVDHGTITTGSSFAEETTKSSLEDPLIVIENISATSVTISCNKQLRAGIIRVTLEGAQGVEEALAARKAIKVVRNGQLLILKGNKTFNAQGAIVK